MIVPWRGDTVMNTLTVLLAVPGLDVEHDPVALTANNTEPDDVYGVLRKLAAEPPADPVELAAKVAVKTAHKYDHYLTPDLLAHAYAARSLDIPNTWNALRELAGEIAPVTAFLRGHRSARTGRPIELGITPFAVLDVETTGFDPFGRDRVIEIAIARLSPDGEPIDRWTTLVDPGRPPGPTHVHGITADDLRGAPTFAEIADESPPASTALSSSPTTPTTTCASSPPSSNAWDGRRRHGRHCARWRLSYLTGSASSRRLSDLCEAEGLTHHGQHTALGDADATSRLFLVYLRRAKAAGITRFDQLGVTALELPPAVPSPSHPPQLCPRTTGAVVPTSKTPAPATGDPRIDVYLNAVEEAMADAALAEEETGSLDRLAQELGVDQETATMLHRRFAAAGPISG